MERSLMILKPDFYERDIYQEFCEVLRTYHLVVEYDFHVMFESVDDVKNFYQWETLWNIEMMIQYWCKTPHSVLVISGESAIQKATQIKKFFRSKYCNDCHKMYTLIHCPDTFSDYQRELNFLSSKKLVH